MTAEVQTPRLLLRRWRESDREPFAALNADAEVMEYFPAPLTRAESDALIDRIEAGFERQGFGWWALEVRETGVFAGFAGLNRVGFEAPFTPAIEVGWRLARPAWGHGYATEATLAALQDAGHPEVVSFTAVPNARSRAVMERVGMTFEGEFDHPRLREGHPLRRHVLYRRMRGR